MFTRVVFVLTFLAFAHSALDGASIFRDRVTMGQVTSLALDLVTGMAASRVHPNIVYLQNNQQGSNVIYAVDVTNGQEMARLTIQGAQNYDWEDLAYGPCVDDCRSSPCSVSITPSRYCLYIADIGSHSTIGAANNLYMVREPTTLMTGDAPVVDQLSFSWSEEDAETIMVAPDGRVYIVSKIQTGRAMLVELPLTSWGKTVILDLSNSGILKISTEHHDPQGGDISPDGKEMIFVCEEDVFYYSVVGTDYITTVRTTYPVSIANYTSIPDTEAIAWSHDGQGFYTLTMGVNQYIYYYPKA